MIGRHALLVLALPVFTSACAARTETSSAPDPNRPGLVADPLAAPWTIVERAAPRTQRLVLSARLHTEMDSLVREDSVRSTLEAQWVPVPGSAPKRWSGVITAFRVRANVADSAVAPDGVVFPIRFDAVAGTAGTQPTIVAPEAELCETASAGIVQGWRELWVSPPATLRPGTTWQDSTAYTLCRDGIPLLVASVRSYVAESAVLRDSAVHVVVVRRSRVVLEGTGMQFGDTVRVLGGGSSTVRLLLPLSGGAMTGEGEGVLTLELRGRRRTQRLTQQSLLEIHAP